jgi:Uma2 family endonuclease
VEANECAGGILGAERGVEGAPPKGGPAMSTARRSEAPAGRMTYEQFMDWADEDTLAEWVDGRVIMTSPASLPHQELVDFVHDLLKRCAALHDLGRAIQAPFVQHLSDIPSAREPDVLFVAREHLDRLTPPGRATSLEGPADLVVEVLSPDSVKRDYEDKFREYAWGGVPEYWIVDVTSRQARFFQLDAQGTYQPVAPDAQGVYRSRAVPGLWLREEWLWQDPLPDVERVVREIAGPAHAGDLAAQADDAYVRALLDELRRLGKLPENGGQ